MPIKYSVPAIIAANDRVTARTACTIAGPPDSSDRSPIADRINPLFVKPDTAAPCHCCHDYTAVESRAVIPVPAHYPPRPGSNTPVKETVQEKERVIRAGI